MAANISIPSLSSRAYRPVVVPQTTDLYGAGGPGTNAGMNMMNNVLTSNASLGKELALQAMEDKSALTIADMNNKAAIEKAKIMYKGPTLFDKLTAINSLFDSDPIQVGVGNSNLRNGSAIGLTNNPTTNAYNAALEETLKKEFLEGMEKIRLGEQSGLTDYSEIFNNSNVNSILNNNALENLNPK